MTTNLDWHNALSAQNLNTNLQSGWYVSLDTFASRLAVPPAQVQAWHEQGRLYVRRFSQSGYGLPRLAQLQQSLPQETGDLTALKAFVANAKNMTQDGRYVAYPAWQIREASNGQAAELRPEIALAREAFADYAQEIVRTMQPKNGEPAALSPQTCPDVDGDWDSALYSFFECLPINLAHVILQREQQPRRPVYDREKMVQLWWEEINPFGDFS